jgi:Bacterial SCP ortholog
MLPNRYRAPVARRLTPATPEVVAAWLDRLGTSADPDPEVLRNLTKHFLAVLGERAPGNSVEVRVPPYAAVQCVAGTRHTRGTPPATVETDALTWIRLATGDLGWAEAVANGRLTHSGERSDLSAMLPLV